MRRPAELSTEPLDYAIIGGGPAGLQLGYFLERSRRRYVILEGSAGVACFFRRFPRHRQLISFNKVHSVYDDPEIRLRWDWNSLLTEGYEFEFRQYSEALYPNADDLVRYLEDFAQKYELNISFDSVVVAVHRTAEGTFRLSLENGAQIHSRSVVVATGLSKSYVPPIPGVELAEGYDEVSVDPEGYRGQRVLILGKGNSAFELAESLIDVASLVHLASPNPVRLAWNTKHPGHVRAHAVRLLDMYQLKLLNGALDCNISAITPIEDRFAVSVAYSHADGETETVMYDRVIRCTGFRFDDTIFGSGCRPQLTLGGRLPAMSPAWESTNVPGLFFAGTLMQARDFRRASSAFIDGFRYNIRTLHRLLEERDHGRPLERTAIAADASALGRHVLSRVSRTSALWAQFGFLCDALVVDQANDTSVYVEELPVDYVHESAIGQQRHYYTITFEWGSWTGDLFAIERHPQAATADHSAFLHPVVRRFDQESELRVHHVLEDLFGNYGPSSGSGVVVSRQGRSIESYHDREHRAPLEAFFAENLREPTS